MENVKINPQNNRLRYVLITSAFNEESNIEKTILSVVSQQILPIKWIIISDGSTDNTDSIVKKYTKHNLFIDYVRVERNEKRSFLSKVYAIRAGYERLKDLDFDYIGNLDADIELIPEYYDNIMKKFDISPNLGIATGTYIEKATNGKIVKDNKPNYHTPGSIQFFRRECYEDIGGYPLIDGGEDTAAGLNARMKGWKTKSFQNLEVIHLKRIYTGNIVKIIKAKFRFGKVDYLLGMHPLFAIIKFGRQLFLPPHIIGGVAILSGFTYMLLKGENRHLNNESIKYFRKEQFNRVVKLFTLNKLFKNT